MVAGSFVNQIASPLPPSRLWKAFIKDLHNLLPKLVPKQISSVDFLEGDGGVGTIMQFNFYPGARVGYSYAKDRVDEVDDDKFVYKYTTVEGGVVGTKASAMSYEIKFEAAPEGGSLATFTNNYDTLSDAPPSQAEVDRAKAERAACFKAVEAFLLANPTAYA